MTAAIPPPDTRPSDLLTTAIAAVRALPLENQEEIARAMLDFVRMAGPELGDDDLELDADLAESIAQADRGEFVSEEEVRALWAKARS